MPEPLFSNGDLERWHTGLADVVATTDPGLSCARLCEELALLIPSAQWWVIFYRKGEVPILFSYYDRNTRADRYAEGPYLHCPFYNAFVRCIEPGCYSARALGNAEPIKFQRYADYYFEPMGPLDEIGMLEWLDDQTMVLVSLDRSSDMPRYSGQDLARLACLSPVTTSVVRNAWKQAGGAYQAGHAQREALFDRHTERMESFGRGVLTEREVEIARYLLKGFSAKEVARISGITEGTARVHMRQIYAKLGVSSQVQLCGDFIEQLLQPRE